MRLRQEWSRVAGWVALLFPLLVYLLTLDGATSTNGIDASIIGTQYALWKHGSFSLGIPPNLPVSTVDYGVYNGQAYSAIAPGMALLSYPFAAIGFALVGGSVALPGPVQVVDEVFLAMTASIAMYFVYRICRLYSGVETSLLVALAAAFSTPVWPFATVVFANAPSLMFTVIAVYCVLRSATAPSSLRLPAAGGLFLGLACFVEYAAALFIVPLAVFIRYRTKSWKSFGLFVAASLVGPVAQAVYDFELFGNPLVLPEQLKSGTVSLPSAFSIWSAPAHAEYYLMSPYRGIIFLCPILMLGLYAMYSNWRTRQMRPESLLFLSLACLVISFYSSWSDWAGGLAYGPRFLTIAVPYFLIPLAPYLGGTRRVSEWILAFGLIIYGSVIQGAGALTGAFSVSGDPWTFQPLALSLPRLIQGKLDSWWISWGGLEGTAIPWVFAGAVFLSIWLVLLALTPGSRLRGSDV